MFKQDPIEVLRDCEALLVPTGDRVFLQKGSLVTLTQALGGAYTVYVNGNLARVAGRDGDALGMIVMEELDVNTLTGTTEQKIWALLATCYDPEIPVNIAELGLVYECHVKGALATVRMTLTAPGCGMGPVLVAEIEEKIRRLPEIAEVKVELVFDPPWERSMMSEAAKLQLGMM